MDMLEHMNTTIDYIEEHLLEELHMPMIAKIAGTSETEIQKTFYALTGISIMEYVRRGWICASKKRENSVRDCLGAWLFFAGLVHKSIPPDARNDTIGRQKGRVPIEILWKNHLCINDQRS